MASTVISDQKLMFYPTEKMETYRILGMLGSVKIKEYERYNLKKELGDDKYKELGVISLDNQIDSGYVYYDYFLQQRNYDAIKKYFEYSLAYGKKENEYITICDGFAGEADWLNLFNTAMDYSQYDANLLTIANELEYNRYNQIITKNIDEITNESFEDFNIPKNSVSLYLYNPPYGSTGSAGNMIRNVKYYLKMTLEKEFIYNPKNSRDYKQGYAVFVIRKDDFLDSLDLLCKYFRINENSIYKVHADEYEKYKQYVFIAQIRKNPFDFNKQIDLFDYNKHYNNIKSIIESEPEFNIKKYMNIYYMKYTEIPYYTLKENYEIIKNKINYNSKKDSVYNWIKEVTEVKDLSCEKLEVPKPLKESEIAQVLASGYINGNISLKDENNITYGNHIVVGGTKTVITTEENIKKGDDGKKITETKTIKMSKPYLNVLCNINGQLTIKELGE